jgi:uncharacterized delta-60 repeat protein
MLVAKDGRIVVFGSLAADLRTDVVERYRPDGKLDLSFGVGGVARLPDTGWRFAAATLAGDGAIVLAGGPSHDPAPYGFAVARLTSDGRLDGSFGDGGITWAAGPNGPATGAAVALQTDGKIVVGGAFTALDAGGGGIERPDFGLMRFNPDGSRDTRFGQDGAARVRWGWHRGSNLTGIAVASDGRIVASGDADADLSRTFAAARLLPDGTLDPSFGDGGQARLGVDGFVESRQLVLQPDGKPVVAGGYLFGTPLPGEQFGGKGLALGRLDAAGQPDASFGATGVVRTIASPGVDLIRGLALQPDGKIVAGGTSSVCGRPVFTVLRYLGDVPAPTVARPSSPVTVCDVPPAENGGAVVPLPLNCQLIVDLCQGTASLTTSTGGGTTAPRSGGAERFRVQGGRTGTVRIHLTRSAHRVLRQRGTIRAVATLVVANGRGAPLVKRQRVVVRYVRKTGS